MSVALMAIGEILALANDFCKSFKFSLTGLASGLLSIILILASLAMVVLKANQEHSAMSCQTKGLKFSSNELAAKCQTNLYSVIENFDYVKINNSTLNLP